MSEYFFDSHDDGAGGVYFDPAGTFAPPQRAWLFDSSDDGAGSIYFDSNMVRSGGAVIIFSMMQ